MHALWDGLLGPRFDEGDIKRRQKEIEQVDSGELAAKIRRVVNPLDPMTWLAESGELAKIAVYADEVRAPIDRAMEDGSALMPINLSDQYLKRAGRIAQDRAHYAAARLFLILREDIGTAK